MLAYAIKLYTFRGDRPNKDVNNQADYYKIVTKLVAKGMIREELKDKTRKYTLRSNLARSALAFYTNLDATIKGSFDKSLVALRTRYKRSTVMDYRQA